MDRDVYLSKMDELLSDNNTYNVIHKEPLRNITKSLRDLLLRWKNREYISLATQRYLYVSDGVLPRAYGLPKIHKANWPLRLIVSSVNSPLYRLATFLHNTMHKFFLNQTVMSPIVFN